MHPASAPQRGLVLWVDNAVVEAEAGRPIARLEGRAIQVEPSAALGKDHARRHRQRSTALGNGLFKPVLTVIIGRLPHASPHDRDAAFSTFFVFINIGGLLSLILGGLLSSRFGWGCVFAAAAATGRVCRGWPSLRRHAVAFSLLAWMTPAPGALAPGAGLALALVLLAASELLSTPVINATLTRVAPR